MNSLNYRGENMKQYKKECKLEKDIELKETII